MATRFLLILEYLALFVALPVLFATRRLPLPLILTLWGLSAVCLLALLASRSFDRRLLWNAERFRSRAIRALLPLLVVVPLLVLATLWLAPERLFAFVRTRPATWALVMVLYPVLSAYPQGVIYRSFVFHRYRSLLPGRWQRILASAVAFSVAHVVMQNWIAPLFTFGGGVLFAWTYERTRSGLVATLQHAACGCWSFTVGLGWYFYYGSVG
jgi:membrane protease YdiL (CAAX protease family)